MNMSQLLSEEPDEQREPGKRKTEQVENFGEFSSLDLSPHWPLFRAWLLRQANLLGQFIHIPLLDLQDLDAKREGRAVFSATPAPPLKQPYIFLFAQGTGVKAQDLGRYLAAISQMQDTLLLWVAPHFPEKMQQALTWLNSISPNKCYCFEASLVRIGDSPVVPHLQLILWPGLLSPVQSQ